MDLDLGLLGPLLMNVDGRPFAPSAPKQRQLLALLMLNLGHVVPLSHIIEELWDDEPPRTAPSAVQSYVLQLRRLMCGMPGVGSLAVAGTVLQTKNGGYSLARERGRLDAEEFEDRLRQARAAARHGDPARTARLYHEALDIWRGPALIDVPAGPRLQRHITALEESRLQALEQRVEAELQVGRHHELLSELRMLVMRYPSNENLHAQFMIALFRSGRQVEALEVFTRLRAFVKSDLGIELSGRIRRLHQAILVSDPILETPVRAASPITLDLVRHDTCRPGVA
ncbi:AfsR/SARP family transcriptional regulator [Actinomadura gamaensis]|uniref:BTAD domain-containing putative transcriptional regulator n=1 Tax=Actinomadura gamaensis TaxID=1763541 RepID=A0ABV9TZT9_9ACTN